MRNHVAFEWDFGGGADVRDAEGVIRATLAAGEIVSCGLCHSIEKSFED